MNDLSNLTADLHFDSADALGRLAERLEVTWRSPHDQPPTLTSAGRYTLLQGGKRIRGLFTMMVTSAWGCPIERAVDVAAAVEMIHAASLIIDDLPCMDDGSLRRGLPTNHVVHGEATAILAAFALMGEAFAVVAGSSALADRQRTEATAALAAAIGPPGLTGGQYEDLYASAATLDAVERVHRSKTAALFVAAAELGSIAAGIGGPRRTLMMDCGACLGLAFQALDDFIDVSDTAAVAGKDVLQDQARANIVTIAGDDVAVARIARHIATARDCAEASGANPAAITALLAETERMLIARRRSDAARSSSTTGGGDDGRSP